MAQQELEKTREAFFQSQKMEAIGQLTGGIAHDFNNLLMAVLSSLEMLRRKMPDDPKLLQLLDNAVQGAERGAALTQRMLSFARKQESRTSSRWTCLASGRPPGPAGANAGDLGNRERAHTGQGARGECRRQPA